MFRGYDDDDDRPQQTASGYKIPDRDFFRKNFSSFPSMVNHFHDKLYVRSARERRWAQPHYSSLVNVTTPYSNLLNPADGICCHFLRKGFMKPTKILFTTALWSPDARWLVVGTQRGDFVIWESEALKVHKLISVTAHKDFKNQDEISEEYAMTAMAWKHYGNMIVTGDSRGLIHYSNEAFKATSTTRDAHAGAVRGLSFSPWDTKLVSCGDDAKLKLWSGGRNEPEVEMLGHKQDIKCVDWHPYRSLVASGSRDTTVKLWDPKTGSCVSTIACSERQVNTAQWNMNGNWLATGAIDGFVKLYDIRTMKEFESWRINQGEDSICKVAWHPIHESLIVSGTFNGSLCYWVAGQGEANMPHSLIRDAHRLSIDVLSWHPAGHILASTSYDMILKFWSREPPGSKLLPPASENNQEFPPKYYHGPLERDTYIAPVRNPATQSSAQAMAMSGGAASGGHRGYRGGAGGGDQSRYGQHRQSDGGNSRFNRGPRESGFKRSREQGERSHYQ